MRFSRTLKSSSQSLPSPNGAYIATILPSKLSIRATRSLELARVISLPPELTASLHWFLWSQSSQRLLLASQDNIRVYSIANAQFSANITNPSSGTARVSFVSFGATDDEVCAFLEFGLKISVFNLSTSKSVDISGPKLFNPGVAGKGISYRPRTLNTALLTRSGGKDVISIHVPHTLQVRRSWNPETIDAAGISWSPDGRWLVVWESAAQGHTVLVYTADGHLYKRWNGPAPIPADETDLALGAGVKVFEWSPDGSCIAIGDYSKRVSILAIPAFTETISLVHTPAIKPSDTLQIWHEQIVPSPTGFTRIFTQTGQQTYPPTSSLPNNNPSTDSVKAGTTVLTFDVSSTLLATVTEINPTTLWIWDIRTLNLRSVLILHSPIAKVTWHPSTNEVLLIRCEGEESRGLVHLWDPSWETPKIVDFATLVPGGKVIGRTVGRWLNTPSHSSASIPSSSAPSIFFSDSQDYMLASLGDGDEEVLWQEEAIRAVDIYGRREESPLNLIPADEMEMQLGTNLGGDLEADGTDFSGGSGEVDDTFRFKKPVSSWKDASGISEMF